MGTIDPAVEAHYTRDGLAEQVLQALHSAGKDIDALLPEDLAPIDEFHIRGRDASLEMIALAGFRPGDRILDVGCGIGGPSRLLAQQCDCSVTGLDLTEEFCNVAAMLAQRTGLDGRVAYRHGDALDMPFEDGVFDGVWMQHVNMNIEDKAGLFAEIRRVLRPGGRLAFYEIVADSGEPLVFPVPWARHAAISFLVSGQTLKDTLADTGLTLDLWQDQSVQAADWFRQMIERIGRSGPPPLGLHVLVGPDMGLMAKNVLANIDAGRIRVVRGIARA